MQLFNGPVVLIYKIDFNLPEDIFNNLLASIKDKKREKIGRYKFREDALRSLSGELLLKYALIKYAGIDYQKEIIIENEFGKPELENKQVSFNISHSGDWAVLVCHHTDAGIDVEKVEEPPYEIMPRNFTQNEIKQIENCSLQNKSRQFYNIWTLKESYIKMIGQGLSMPLDSFSFDTSNINSIRIITENLDTSDVYSQLFYPDTGHVMAVCLKDHNKKILPYRISIDELFPLY